MNWFDASILHFLNSYAQQSNALDSFMAFLTTDLLPRGGIAMALFWSAWGRNGGEINKRRQILLFGLLMCFLCLFIGRLLALTLPFRPRPLDNPGLNFKIPLGFDPNTLIGWSSFPSDHATLFFCLATVLWMVSWRLGLVAMLHAALIVCIPRIYVGVHYPTDILAGALLGICGGSLAAIPALREKFTHSLMRWMDLHPAPFYAFLFLITFELAELFNSVRNMAHAGLQLFGPALHAFL